MSNHSKEWWVIIRLFFYVIVLGCTTIFFPETIAWTGPAQLILATTELTFTLLPAKNLPKQNFHIPDYDDHFK